MKNTMKKGFTLIELMVVVIIVGILAAVAVPKMAANRERAQMSEATAAVGSLKTAIALYVAENGEPSEANGKNIGTYSNYIDVVEMSGTYYTNYSITKYTDEDDFTVTAPAIAASGAPTATVSVVKGKVTAVAN